MSNAYIFLITIFGWMLQYAVNAQDPAIILNTIVSESDVLVSWYPTDPAAWKEGLTSGYTLTRETISGGGGSFSPVRTMLRDSLWFRDNVKEGDGVLLAVRGIIYGDNFLRRSNRQNDELQYNYIVYESTTDIRIAEATGLGFEDKNTEKGATYRYTVKHNKSGQTTSITIQCVNDERMQEPEDYRHVFHWPDGNSLSDMLEQSEPFVLEAIVGKARPKIDSVMLRWAPTTIGIYRNALVDGYEIWRTKGSEKPVLLTTVKPWSEDRFHSIPLTDSLALLAASIVKNKGIPQGIAELDMYDKASVETNYFSFALHIADRSPLAADVLGLRYVDQEAEFGITYRYEIRTKQLQPNFPVPDIWVTNEFEPLLGPEGFKIIKEDKMVTLQWLAKSDMTNYSAYVIERLNPGDSVYQVLTPTPLVFIQHSEQKMFYNNFIDSVQNGIVYQYRIKGVNAFGEWSDYAYGRGFGLDITPPDPVSIVSGAFQPDSSRIRIAWTLPPDATDTKYHQILLSEDIQYNYSAVSGELPPTDSVFYLDLKGMDTDRPFYFQVMSVDSSGNQSTSIMKTVVVPDYDRPEPPTNFKAIIDSTGLVTATWSPSISKDVTGYYIYYANQSGFSLTMINDYLHKDTVYTWSLPMNTTTKNLYVGVKAEDDNYNKSFITDIITIRRPDTIAPVRPFVHNIELVDESVYLDWKKSSSNDVEKYLVYRRFLSDTSQLWSLIDSVDMATLTYTDKSITFGGYVQYTVKAVDDFGNMSEFSKEVQVRVPFPSGKFVPILSKLTLSKDKSVTVNWEYDTKNHAQLDKSYTYQIFRSTGSQESLLYKEIVGDNSSFSDTDLQPGVLYNYAVRVRYDNGWTSELSEVKSILIK